MKANRGSTVLQFVIAICFAASEAELEAQEGLLLDTRIAVSGAVTEVDGVRTNSREATIRSTKPGFVQLWHYYGDEPLVAPLLEDQDGKGYHRTVSYRAQDIDGGVFVYQIVPEDGEVLRSKKVELWNQRHLSYKEFTDAMGDVADPSGGVLRGVPIDLVPLQDDALLLAVTDGPNLSQSSPWILKIWRPTYHGRTQLPEELVSMPVQVGYMITTSGAATNRVNPPDGQKLGRISQRSGKLVAHLKYEYGSHSAYDGELTLERPFKFDVRLFSGVAFGVVGVLTTQRDSMPFLLKQLRSDLKGTRWEAQFNETIREQDGDGQPSTRSESDSEGGDKLQPETEERSR